MSRLPYDRPSNSSRRHSFAGNSSTAPLHHARKTDLFFEDPYQPAWPSARESPTPEADVLLRYSDLDKVFPRDGDRGRDAVRIGGFEKDFLVRVAAYITRQTTSVVSSASDTDNKDIIRTIKKMLYGCFPGEQNSHSNDPVQNKNNAVVSRVAWNSSIEALGNRKLNLDDEDVFPGRHGYAIEKKWPSMVVQDLPQFGGCLAQRMSTKGGRGLQQSARDKDYHCQYNIRIVADGDDVRPQPGEPWAPIRIRDYQHSPKLSQWSGSALTSTVKFVSYSHYSSWTNAYVIKEDFEQIFQMRIDATFEYGRALAKKAWMQLEAPTASFKRKEVQKEITKRDREDDGNEEYTGSVKRARHTESDGGAHKDTGDKPLASPTARTEAAMCFANTRMGNNTAAEKNDKAGLKKGENIEQEHRADSPMGSAVLGSYDASHTPTKSRKDDEVLEDSHFEPGTANAAPKANISRPFSKQSEERIDLRRSPRTINDIDLVHETSKHRKIKMDSSDAAVSPRSVIGHIGEEHLSEPAQPQQQQPRQSSSRAHHTTTTSHSMLPPQHNSFRKQGTGKLWDKGRGRPW